MSLDPTAAASLGPVAVVGTGLLGTSIGLGLSHCGATVFLSDTSPTALALARDLGAGAIASQVPAADLEAVRLVVVATPPDVTARVVRSQLEAFAGATVTDVASVKAGVLRDVTCAGGDVSRYVGGHPMAGRERSGPVAARGDLFIGRPWVVCPAEGTQPARVDAVRWLALALGATPVAMAAQDHDDAVALVSHVPQVAASLVAARLRKASDSAVALAGQGLRDVTRIAGSDPLLWAQILAANAGPVADVLRAVRDDLDDVLAALGDLAGERADAPVTGARGTVARAIADGNLGRERIPGKHGGQAARYAVVTVLVPDEPGSLGRLFADIGAAGINIEELSLEHAPGRAVGLIEVSVLPAVQEHLETALAQAGWSVVA